MAHDEHVGLHGRQVVDRIEQGLALVGRRGVDIEVDDVGRQALGRDFERRAGTRGVLEKKVENRLSAQQRYLLDFAVADAGEGVGRLQNVHHHRAWKALDGKQMRQLAFCVELRIARHVARTPTREGAPNAAVRTTMRSPVQDPFFFSISENARRPVASRVRFRLWLSASSSRTPTKRASTGSSRPPRSTSTARSMRPGLP